MIFGVKPNMNLSFLRCVCLCRRVILGDTGEKQNWYDLRASCRKCGKQIDGQSGLICGNFAHNRGNLGVCQGAWCPACYRADPLLCFPVKKIEEEDGVELEEDDEERFMYARKGDAIVNIFQCDDCHFKNIYKRPPYETAEDIVIQRYIRRAVLDVFWSRETSTVESTHGEVVRTIRHAKELRLPITGDGRVLFPERGPFPLSDKVGMAEAILTLRRTLDSGRYQQYIQFETARRIRVGFSSYWHASLEVSNTAVIANSAVKL